MYIDLLTKIKNAQQAKLPNVKAPFSKMDLAIAELLAKHKFIELVEKKGRMPKRIIDIKLRYTPDGGGVITGIEFLSHPGVFMAAGVIYPRCCGYGLFILSTPKGIMTGAEAKKKSWRSAIV